MKPIVEVTKLSKQYNINRAGNYIALRDVIGGWLQSPRASLQKKTANQKKFWALKDISFTLNQGETLGIIGPNGAGKSTLLKVLTRITPPTSGSAVLRGSVSSLLEVGTGFHPELTGKENIFLNGAVLGMTRDEINNKFDSIVEFSGVEKFLNTPVKHYSSGMYVRLAFSVAAHLEPDILIVDEVLAVGDAAFQKKCLGKMDEVASKQGRTVIFVSHNMSAIQALCKRCLRIEEGQIKALGPTSTVINDYLKDVENTSVKHRKDRKGNGKIRLTSFYLENNGKRSSFLNTGGDAAFCFEYVTTNGKPVKDVSLASAISLENGTPLILNWNKYTNQTFPTIPPKGRIKCHISQKFPLAEGLYLISANIFIKNDIADFIKHLSVFEVRDGKFYEQITEAKHSPVYVDQTWSVEER